MSATTPPRPLGGRIVLDTFRSTADPMLAAWLHFRAQMILDEPPLTLPDLTSRLDPRPGTSTRGLFGVWRLLAPNNREIGRCASLHVTPVESLVAARAVQCEAGTLIAVPVRGAQPLTHGWVLRGPVGSVLMSPRWYEAAAEAASAARTARSLLASAVLVDGVSIGTGSGRRQRLAMLTPEGAAVSEEGRSEGTGTGHA